jgi:antibiotic biosynthesis monooxygenase (ABM) superfamily enzyme
MNESKEKEKNVELNSDLNKEHEGDSVRRTFSLSEKWFKISGSPISRKTGIGLMPISWEGVLSYIVFIGLIIFFGFYLEIQKLEIQRIIIFILILAMLIFSFIILSKNTTEESY